MKTLTRIALLTITLPIALACCLSKGNPVADRFMQMWNVDFSLVIGR